MRPIVLFDLDGTLVDTAPDLIISLNHVLASRDIAPVTYDDITHLVGFGALAMIERAFSLRGVPLDPAERPALLDQFVAHYVAGMPGRSLPFAGTTEALERLREAGFALAVCTNKLERLAVRLIEGLELGPYFETIAGGDTFPVRKPDAKHLLMTIEKSAGDPARAIMIGDSFNDIKAASNAGVPSIAVTFGYSDVPVATLNPDRIIDTFDDLTPALVRTLIGSS